MIRNISARRQQHPHNNPPSSKYLPILTNMHTDLSKHNYDLSDQVSSCYINPAITQENRYIKIETLIIPKSGVFQHIQFKPVVYINIGSMLLSPQIYNDRKVYHPNIDMYHNKIAVEGAEGWNTSMSVVELLSRLKYTVVEPNSAYVPNNQLNKRAGFLYVFSREKFQAAILDNCPAFLESQAQLIQEYERGKNETGDTESEMDIESQNSSESLQRQTQNTGYKKYINIKEMIPDFKASHSHRDEEENNLEIELLSKKLKKVNLIDTMEM